MNENAVKVRIKYALMKAWLEVTAIVASSTTREPTDVEVEKIAGAVVDFFVDTAVAIKELD